MSINIITKKYKNDSLNLKKTFISNLRDYIKKQQYPTTIIKEIIDQSFIDSNPSYYTYYPHLFKNAFNVFDEEILKILSLAGFLYYKAVLNIDYIFDQKESQNSFQQYIIANICQEETIKLLSQLFSSNHPFWKLWNKRKMEYMKAYKIDRTHNGIHNYGDYEELADYKCAFGKIAIDSLYLLSHERNKKLYHKILESHKYFYVGFQLIDDITDLQEDMENEQFNILHYEAKKIVASEEIKNMKITELKKELFLNGTISKVQEKALSYLQKSMRYTENLNVDQWNFEVQKQHNSVIRHKLNADGYVNVFKTRNKLSIEKVKKENNQTESIALGIDFIKNAQNKDGSWDDYFNEAGVSNTWTTAFILSRFALNFKEAYPELSKKAMVYLKESINKDFMWGYNDSWMSDADSTTFAMLALNASGAKINSKTIENWLKYQNDDGGFSTYNSADDVKISLGNEYITNVDGWLQSHICVSASAYYLFARLNIKNDALVKLQKYVLKNIKIKKQQHSYWWTDFMYTLSFLIKGALIFNDQDILSYAYKLIDGYMQDISSKLSPKDFFYQGLLLDCVCSSKFLYEKYKSKISKIASSLVINQFTDGSWEENYALRIPEPSEKFPSRKSIKWIQSDKGTNIILRDYHRLFTTISSIAGLNAYQKS